MTKQSDSSIRYISDSSPATPSFVVDVSIFTEKERQKIRKQTVNILKEYSKPKEINNV
jgi:Trm5-related predicted tRNA methylase